MTRTITARFDGKVFVPDEPLQFPVGQSIQFQVELPDSPTPRFSELLTLEADLPDAPSDLAAQVDHYLYGTPKR